MLREQRDRRPRQARYIALRVRPPPRMARPRVLAEGQRERRLEHPLVSGTVRRSVRV